MPRARIVSLEEWAGDLYNAGRDPVTRAARVSGRNTSGYRGVWWNEWSRRWRACIEVGGQTRHLGSFYTAEDAASAYDSAATVFHGERAVLNFPVGEGS